MRERSDLITRQDGAHGGIGVDLQGVHLPLGTQANRLHAHEQEAHGQKTDVHKLTDDSQPEDIWERNEGGEKTCSVRVHSVCCFGKKTTACANLESLLELAQ